MAVVLQEVDGDDLTTVLFDYADSTGVNNAGSVKTWFGVGGTFSLGAPTVTVEDSERQAEGRRDVTFSYEDLVSSSFSIRLQASSYDNLRTGVGVLQRLLGADGVMRYIPTGSTQTFYIYRKPSNIPALFSGAELELYKAGSLTEGTIPISFLRERLLRGATLLSSVNILQNATMLIATASSAKDMYLWGWDSGTNITTTGYGANVNWPNQSYRFTIATTGTRNFQYGTGGATAAPGDVWTFSFYAKATGGTLCKAQAVLEFMSSAPAVLATATGTLTTLSATEQRLTVTSSAAPASTDRIRVNLRFANGDATSYTVDVRRAQLEKAASASAFRVGVERLTGDISVEPFGGMFVYNPGDANALARVSLLSSTATTLAYNLARKSEGLDVNLAEAHNRMTSARTSLRRAAYIIDATMYSGTAGDTSSVADGASTLGNAAKTTFTNQDSMVRRWRWVNTPTDTETLHGRWDVYCAIRPEVGSATDTRYRVCLHWQAANRDPVTNVEDEVPIDATDAYTSTYAPVRLGTVEFDADAGDTALVLEGWAARDTTGANSLWWDVVYLVPADEQQTLLQVPGFREGEQGKEVWLGSELTSDPSTRKPAGVEAGAAISGTKVILDTVNEGAGMPPSTATTGGLVWAAGWHEVSALCDLRVPAGTAATGLGQLRIRKAPGPGASVNAWAATTVYALGAFVKPTVANLNNRTYVATSVSGTHTSGGSEPAWPTTDGGTVTDNAGANQIVWTETTVVSRPLRTKKNFTSTRKPFTVGYTADGTTAYEFVIVAGTGITGANGKINILRVAHTVLRVVDSGYSAQMRGDTELMQTASSAGVSTDDLVKQGPFITLGPGLNILWADVWSLPPSAYDDMSDEALAKRDPTVITTASVDVIPRYWS